MAEARPNLYPKFVVKNTQNPSRLLAFPFLGIVIRFILLIPAFFVMIFYGLFILILWLILPFYILFTGKYWDTAYTHFMKYFKYSNKLTLYIYGLTDKYPGFEFSESGIFEFNIEKPAKPSRFLAFPLLGFIIRYILLIPYIIYVAVLSRSTQLAVLGSWFGVLFNKRYPESLYEFNRDSLRVMNAQSMYMLYLSDKYPSFWISMNHKPVKITLLVLGALLVIFGAFNSGSQDRQQSQYDNYSNMQFQNSDYNTSGY